MGVAFAGCAPTASQWHRFSAFWLRSSVSMDTAREETVVPAMVVRLRNSVRVKVLGEADRLVKQRFRREFLLMDVLKGVFNVAASSVFCLQDFAMVGFMDLTFFNLTDCVGFFESWGRKKHNLLEGLQLQPLFAQDFLPLTIHLYNPYVEDSEVLTFLTRHCETVKGGERVRDRFGIWTGKRRYLVKLRMDPSRPGGLVHPPGSFSIGPNRGFLYYSGQPMYCRRCGGEGHVKADCEELRCRLCGAVDHVASGCSAPKHCSLCGKPDHLYRVCPLRSKSYASLLKEGEDLQADLEAILTSLPAVMDEQSGGRTTLEEQEKDGEPDRGEVNVNNQQATGSGDLISLSMDESEVAVEQQTDPSQVWSELDIAEVWSGGLGVGEERDVLEPTPGSLGQRDGVSRGSERENSADSGPGTNRCRTWDDLEDQKKEEGRKLCKLENIVSQEAVGKEVREEGSEEEEQEEEEGEMDTEWGVRVEKDEMLTQSGSSARGCQLSRHSTALIVDSIISRIRQRLSGFVGSLSRLCRLPRFEEERCRRCSKLGHTTRECSIPKACHSCGSLSHLMKECKEYRKQYGGGIRVEETETERQMGEGGQQEIIEQQVKEKETIGEGKEGREDAKEVEDAMAAFLEALNGEQFKVTEQYSDEVDDEMEVERQSAPDGSRGDGSQLVRKAEKKKERPSKKVRAESMLKLTFSEETEESLSTDSQEGLEMDNARALFQLTEEKDRSRNGDQKDESSGLSVTPISCLELVLAETEDTSLEGQEMEGTLKTE
ncbi:Zinc finger CCHC domain-containing protein 3 [Anabarilius grahami]|uniref:Zinc finger CCHC domain-containing protein 3 n=1 Tax=Anabarilius grahami TaxID=495550 RepID=A0A3N0XN07_ANAGA|nr:Zinc finger CCHC domain-containing protein 3 [Anabarilius grahami]